MPVFLLTDELVFPPVELATPDGLLAVGGDLGVERLLLAYRSGIFPWYSEGEPILWWSPDPRFVLYPDRLKVSNSLRRVIRSGRFTVSLNRDFRAVVEHCRTVRRTADTGTWIMPEMVDAYCRLREAGHALSVDVRQGDALVGGLYGVQVGHCFCGESMFAHVSNASKVGFVWLVEHLAEQGCDLIDCQVHTAHLESFGAEFIPRRDFLGMLAAAVGHGGTAAPG
jgi:leucyl/phenylalanyl-tRNA---protein transferase